MPCSASSRERFGEQPRQTPWAVISPYANERHFRTIGSCESAVRSVGARVGGDEVVADEFGGLVVGAERGEVGDHDPVSGVPGVIGQRHGPMLGPMMQPEDTASRRGAAPPAFACVGR